MKIVVSHSNADLDALACTIAASRLYDAVPVGSTSRSPSVKRFLALHKDRFPLVAPDEIDADEVEEVIVVDVRDRRRLRDIHHILEAGPRIVVWDHHPSTKWDVEADESHVEPVGACVTLLLEALGEADREITAEEATLFMLGIYADTGRLSYSSTRARDMKAAAQLLGRGASLKIVNRYLRDTLTPEQSSLLVEMMASVEELSIDHVEVAIGTATAYQTVRGASSVVQQVMELGGHDAMFGAIFFEKNRRVQLIGRSRVSYVDVGEVLREFGGGGHQGAGAASVKKAELSDVVARLRSALVDAPLQPTRVSQIMTSPVAFVEHDMTLGDALQKLDEWGVTGAPVLRDGELSGICSRRDIRRAEQSNNLDLPVSSHMAHEVLTVDDQEPIEDALEMMTSRDVGRMPVMRDGEIVGIVTRTDLIKRLYMKARDDSDLEG